MEAKTWSLGEILKPERRYIIPTFQRSYEWTRQGQWELLFADLVATAERLRSQRRAAELFNKDPDEASVPPHFLGAVVCDTLPFPAGGVALRSIIDGQQRLTTIQLLLRGLLDAVRQFDKEDQLRGKIKSLTKMISNDEDSGSTPEDAFKLWPRRNDRELWPLVIADEIPAYAKGDHPYLQARKYFADAAIDVVSSNESEDSTLILRSMVDAIDTLFKIVVIDLEKNDDAQVIFEVLNGRQQTLSASDLVKNLIFLRAEFAKTDELEEMYDRYWADFDRDWWKIKVGTGHAQRHRRDVLLSVWLTAVTAKDVSIGSLYGEVRAYLDSEKPNTEDLLKELNRFSTAYEEIYNALPVTDPVLRRAYDRLIELNNLTAIPVLAWMRTQPDSIMTPTEHRRAVQAIESFTVRRMIAGWTTRNYNAVFVRVMKEAREAPVGKVYESIANELVSTGWPTDSQLEKAMLGSNFYSMAQFRQRLVLAGVDQQLRADDPKQAPGTVEYQKLHIEHVLPRSWQKHWPLPEGLDDLAKINAESEREAAKNRIGNLTLVTQHFNGAVSNLGWATKKAEFAKQSSIILNVELSRFESWDETAIAERARFLARVAAKVWPSPPVTPADRLIENEN